MNPFFAPTGPPSYDKDDHEISGSRTTGGEPPHNSSTPPPRKANVTPTKQKDTSSTTPSKLSPEQLSWLETFQLNSLEKSLRSDDEQSAMTTLTESLSRVQANHALSLKKGNPGFLFKKLVKTASRHASKLIEGATSSTSSTAAATTTNDSLWDWEDVERPSNPLNCRSSSFASDPSLASFADQPAGFLQSRLDPSRHFNIPDTTTPQNSSDLFSLIFGSPLAKAKAKRRREYIKACTPEDLAFFKQCPEMSIDDWLDALDSERDYDPNADKEALQPNATTPLHEAARIASSSLLEVFIETASNPHAIDGQRRTALHLVCGGYTADEVECNPTMKSAIQSLQGNSTTPIKQQQRPRSKSNPAGVDKSFVTILDAKRAAALELLISSDFSVNAVDSRGRTALHYAAQLGRWSLCRALITAGAILTIVEEESQQTPCELAGDAGFADLSAWLEAGAVFDDDAVTSSYASNDQLDGGGAAITPYAWFSNLGAEDVDKERQVRIELAAAMLSRHATSCSTDLSHYAENGSAIFGDGGVEAAKALVLESLSATYVPLVYSEEQVVQMLTQANWDILNLEELYTADPAAYLKECRLNLAPGDLVGILEAAASGGVKCDSTAPTDSAAECPICYGDFDATNSAEWTQLPDHSHAVCKECLAMHVADAATNSRASLLIRCPFQNCAYFVPRAVLQAHSSAETMEKLVQNERDAFVFSARDVKYCPTSACPCVVVMRTPVDFSRRWGSDCLDHAPAICSLTSDNTSSSGVALRTRDGVVDANIHDSTHTPLTPHRFCWQCDSKPHWPIPCDMWEQWQDKIKDEIGELPDGKGNADESSDAVMHQLWIKANTKKCPKCKTPIEKDEGCNHMTCSSRRCRHEFCWVCAKPWDMHGTNTGGYFSCNIWREDEELLKIADESGMKMDEENNAFGSAKEQTKRTKAMAAMMARFVHHMTRSNAHADSAVLELAMQQGLCARLKPVVEAARERRASASEVDLEVESLDFVRSAFIELIECRSFLRFSYVLAFYRYSKARSQTTTNLKKRSRSSRALYAEKQTFEVLQSELEMLVEQMSDIVARKHMRASKCQVGMATAAAAAKRTEMGLRVVGILNEIKIDKNSREKDGKPPLSKSQMENEAKLKADLASSAEPTKAAAASKGSKGAASRSKAKAAKKSKKKKVYDDDELSGGEDDENGGVGSNSERELSAMLALLEEAFSAGDARVEQTDLEMVGALLSRARERGRQLTQEEETADDTSAGMSRGMQAKLARQASARESARRARIEMENAIQASIQDENCRGGRGGGVTEGEKEQKVDEPFDCAVCTFHNERGLMCEMCGAEKPATEKENETKERGAAQQEDAPRPEQQAVTSDGTSWECSTCTLINECSAKQCAVCGVKREKEERKEKLQQVASDEGDAAGTTAVAVSSNPICEVCGMKALARCTRCENAFYCGRVCQVQAWTEHKLTCVPPANQLKEAETRRSKAVASIAEGAEEADEAEDKDKEEGSGEAAEDDDDMMQQALALSLGVSVDTIIVNTPPSPPRKL
jgi:ankyrin repeat/IBR domain-containing protein 1